MPEFEHKRTGRRTTVSGAAAEEAYRANPTWREVEADKPLTPKQQLQAEAEALGLAADGKSDEIKARIDAKVTELHAQAEELGIDGDELSAVDLQAAIDAKLA